MHWDSLAIAVSTAIFASTFMKSLGALVKSYIRKDRPHRLEIIVDGQVLVVDASSQDDNSKRDLDRAIEAVHRADCAA